MDLLFTIDRKFIPLFLSCVRSIVKNGGFPRYTAYILHSDLTPEDRAEMARGAGPAVECRFLTVDPALFEGFPESRRCPRQIYYRLASPLLPPVELERVLYLDVDTVVINSLRPLAETPFDGACYMACTHTRRFLSKLNQLRLGAEREVPYINTGVLVMDLPALREHLDAVRVYADRRKDALLLPDQDILTVLYGDKVKLLDSMVYNLSDRVLAFHNADPSKEKVDVDWVRANSVVIYYCGKAKPWKPNYMGVLDVFYHKLEG